jgi:hypothetical protein
MNRIYVGFVFFGLLVFFNGCVEQQKSKPQAVTGKADTKFPEFLVGVWQADGTNWAFKFEPDGKISKLMHIIGAQIDVNEGSSYEEGRENSQFLYVLGPCSTNYDPKSRVLKVSIVMDYFLMDMPAGTIEGWSKDFFEGPVSAKDLTWNVKWRSYSALEGESPPDVNFIDANPATLVFRKLDLKEFEKHKHQPAPPVRQHSK